MLHSMLCDTEQIAYSPFTRVPLSDKLRIAIKPMCWILCDTMIVTGSGFWLFLITDTADFFSFLGSLEITWQEIMVGIESGLLMFPINILIITIFRSIKPRVISKSKKDDPEENIRQPPVTIPSTLKVCSAFISVWDHIYEHFTQKHMMFVSLLLFSEC